MSTNLGAPMVGISDIKGDAVNFRDREGGAAAEGVIPPKKALVRIWTFIFRSRNSLKEKTRRGTFVS